MTERTPMVEHLDEAESLRLITPGGIGRVAFTGRYGITVLPVNYVLRDGAIVFRTARGGATEEDLRTGIAGADYKVGFEIDHLDEARQEGWSVLVQGSAHHVDADAERAALLAEIAAPWPGGAKEAVLRIVPTRVTGRRITHTT
jgi:nitroimidazol reductase NimA-like FMN-containing flavoprotein (pyridoxamine 5'-phosphate oxidase superfamily)